MLCKAEPSIAQTMQVAAIGTFLRHAEAKRGDLDLDPSLWERAGVSATRPAAVLIPVVARVTPGYSLALNASEVAEAFEVLLAFLMTPTNHQFVKGDWKGIELWYYTMPYQQRYIWGVTAGILRNMYDRLYGG